MVAFFVTSDVESTTINVLNFVSGGGGYRSASWTDLFAVVTYLPYESPLSLASPLWDQASPEGAGYILHTV